MRSLRALAAAALAASLAACAEPPPPVVPIAPVAPAPELIAPASPAPAPPKPPAPPAPTGPARPTGVPGTSIRFTGGDGSTMEQAIIIEGAQGEIDGVRSEYQYLELLLGPRRTWTRTKQSLLHQNGRAYDLLEVDHQGVSKRFYFDITAYFGKI